MQEGYIKKGYVPRIAGEVRVLPHLAKVLQTYAFREYSTFTLACRLMLETNPIVRPFAVVGQRLPSTYINHYCANGGVVVPQFGGVAAEADKRALQIIQEAYGPDYKVVGVSSREVVLNAGNIHCITQQHPAAW